jgi:Peptidase C13 family
VRMILITLALALAFALPPAARAAGPRQPKGWKAILIAGDNRERAFDDAVDAMARKLEHFGVPAQNIAVLKASGDAEDATTRANIEAAFAALHPGPADGCFVYITSHGGEGRGLFIRRADAFLSPHTLDVLLGRGCGDHPSVVIASGCFSGIFAEGPPLTAANRVILTAARDDRPSFGCNADREYTVFDRCLLDNLVRGETWRKVMDGTRACVSGNEWDMRVEYPSQPQLSVGTAVATLRAFAR